MLTVLTLTACGTTRLGGTVNPSGGGGAGIPPIVTFANLGSVVNGQERYCSDCDAPGTVYTPCTSTTGGKTGAWSRGTKNQWICGY